MGKGKEKYDAFVLEERGLPVVPQNAHDLASALRDATICATLYEFHTDIDKSLQQLLQSQREPSVVFVRDSKDDQPSEIVTVTPQELIEENESLRRENSNTKLPKL